MIKVIQSNVSDIHTHHLGTSSLFFNKFSMLQLYKYIQKANNKLKGPHHTVLQANKNFIERTLEQIFHCFLICPNNQQLICMYCISWGKVVFWIRVYKRNTAWSPSWELLLSGLSTYVRSGFNLISTPPKTSWGFAFRWVVQSSNFNIQQNSGSGNRQLFFVAQITNIF